MYEHNKLQKRSEEVKRIRKMHENLKEVIESILGQEHVGKPTRDIAGFMTTKEISDAYQVFQNLDVFDLSKEGEEALTQALRQYE
jgi:hypothetical protein